MIIWLEPPEVFPVEKKIFIHLQVLISYYNPHTPVAQKVANEVVFRGFQGEGVEFF